MRSLASQVVLFRTKHLRHKTFTVFTVFFINHECFSLKQATNKAARDKFLMQLGIFLCEYPQGGLTAEVLSHECFVL